MCCRIRYLIVQPGRMYVYCDQWPCGKGNFFLRTHFPSYEISTFPCSSANVSMFLRKVSIHSVEDSGITSAWVSYLEVFRYIRFSIHIVGQLYLFVSLVSNNQMVVSLIKDWNLTNSLPQSMSNITTALSRKKILSELIFFRKLTCL